MVGDIIAIAISSLTILGAIVVTAWRSGKAFGKLTEEVKGHNKRLDDLTTELKVHCKNEESKNIRKGV